MQLGLRVPIHTAFGTDFEVVGLAYKKKHISKSEIVVLLGLLHENSLEYASKNPGYSYNFVYEEAIRLISMIPESRWELINDSSIAGYSFPFRLQDHGDVYLTVFKTGV